MKIETKYSNGDVVFYIQKDFKQVYKVCKFCDGAGVVVGKDGVTASCPKCYGRGGHQTSEPMRWHVVGSRTIGQINLKITNSPGIKGEKMFTNYMSQYGHEEKYMTIESGIGTGALLDVKDLFSTKDAANAECKRRNKEEEK
jgi:hypothetical protein